MTAHCGITSKERNNPSTALRTWVTHTKMGQREYQRVKIKVDSALYFNEANIDFYEFEGVIKDISESGVKISIVRNESTTALESIKVDSSFHFSFYDEYSLFGNDVSAAVTDSAIVVRKDILDDEIVLGCKFHSPSQELVKYITDIKTNNYYTALVDRLI